MKKLIISLLIVSVISLLTWVSLGPFVTIYRATKATLEGDSETLEKCVDFESVRCSIKAQFLSEVFDNVPKDSNFLSGLMVSLSSVAIQTTIDILVTPEGITQIFREEVGPITGRKNFELAQVIFKPTSFKFASFNKFVFIIPVRSKSIFVILKRQGLSWKISNVVLPLEYLSKIAGEEDL